MVNEDVVRHYPEFLDRRRRPRSADEYKPVTDTEWSEFEEHFDPRKVELGGCARPYGSACQHEHAPLSDVAGVRDTTAPALSEIIRNLGDRIDEARANGWLGEVQGLHVSLDHLRQKLVSTGLIATAARPGGCHDAARLHTELQALGWHGSVQTVRRYLHAFRGSAAAAPAKAPTAPIPPKPRRVARWIMTDPDTCPRETRCG